MKRFTKTVTLLLAAAMLLAVGASAATFTDMRESGHWAAPALNAAIESGLLTGYGDGTIRPEASITRAEAAAIISRVLSLEGGGDVSFSDVEPEDWFYSAVANVTAAGIFNGVGNGKFAPNDPITRQELFTVVARVLGLADGSTSTLNSFKDGSTVAPWAKGAVAAMVEKGYVSGSNGKLDPESHISREELAQVLYNLDSARGQWTRQSYKGTEYMALTGIVYCADPVDTDYETLNIYAPVEYINADGSVNTSVVVNGYISETAPVIFRNNVGGYAPASAGGFISEYVQYIENGYVIVAPGCRGKSSTAEDGSYNGKAPAAIVDLKAAVRWLKANDSQIPGSSDKIVSVGVSAGGALSSLLGATGNSDDYFPYLEAIGADMTVTDDVYAAMCYCPITDLDNADAAYAWQFGPGDDLSDFRTELATALAGSYVDYVNGLELTDKDGDALTLEGLREGSYCEYLLTVLEESLATYLETTYGKTSTGMSSYTYLDQDLCDEFVAKLNADGQWVSISYEMSTASTGPSQTATFASGVKVEMTSLEDFLNNCLSAMKTTTSFDSLTNSSSENQVFGTEDKDYRHYSDSVLAAVRSIGGESWSEADIEYTGFESYDALVAAFEEDIDAISGYETDIRALMNPMNYIGTDKECDTAPWFRIRVGTKDNHTAFTAGMNLALALNKEDVSVNYGLVWGQGHGSADYDGQLVQWIERICKTEARFTAEETAAILNVANSSDHSWEAVDSDRDGIVDCYKLNRVVCVASPELEDYQGISITVPAAYMNPDLTINYDGTVNGYTAATAPIILNTGAAGYSASTTGTAGTGYLSSGYINVACGNRGKSNVAVNAEGQQYYCGDAPYCLVDQKAAVRWLKYNIALGNVPGCADRIVTKGGSGGGAHAIMMAAMGNNPDYYPYLEKSGAIMEYVDPNGNAVAISDGVFACDPLSPITSLEEANMAYEWQFELATDDAVNEKYLSDFRHQLSHIMAAEYVDYINGLGLKDEDGTPLTINRDGKTGTYVDYFEARLIESLEWYLNNLDESSLTWVLEGDESYAEAYVNGHYSKTSRVMGPGYADGTGNTDTGSTLTANGTDLSSWVTISRDENGLWTAEFSIYDYFVYSGRSKTNPSFDDVDLGQAENQEFGDYDQDYRHWDEYVLAAMTGGYDELAAAYNGEADSAATFEQLYQAYAANIAKVQAGDEFGNNIVHLYNPTRYIVDGETELPQHVRIVTGTKDTDTALTISLNCYIMFRMMGVDTVLGWSWDQGHCGNAPLNTSFTGWLDGICK